jgi:hypothetical protein
MISTVSKAIISMVEESRLVKKLRHVPEIDERRIRREILEAQFRIGQIDRVTYQRRRWESGDPPPKP